MTTLAAPPAPSTAPPESPQGGSLFRAEVHRFTSRRFIRVLLLLAIAGYLLAVGLASAAEFARTTPEQLAAAQRNIEQIVEEQNGFREQCLQDPNRPADVPAEAFCGPPGRASDYRAEDFLDKRPFVLADGLPAGALAVAVASAATAFLIGATYVGAEWSSRSMVALLLWEPRRLRVMGVKLAVLVSAVTAIAVVAQAVWWGTARLMAAGLGRTGELPDGFYGDLLAQQGRSVLLVVVTGLLGFGLANLIRSTGAALGVGFVYFAIVENAVRAVRPAWQEWLLADNAIALLSNGGHRIYLFGEGFVDERGFYVDSGRELLLSNLHGGLVLGAATALLVGAGVLLFARRDLH